MKTKHYLFDWGNTLMVDIPQQTGPMCDWPQIEVVSGAKACLVQLSQKSSCHLATNARDSNETQIRLALQRVDLNDKLIKVFCYANLGMGKDDPNYFKQIVLLLNAQPEEVTVIGDSLENDVYPALSAGLGAIWFNPRRHPIPKNIQSIYHLDELGEF
jgi:FMN phosphatase YigB (HAD superfamily)